MIADKISNDFTGALTKSPRIVGIVVVLMLLGIGFPRCHMVVVTEYLSDIHQ